MSAGVDHLEGRVVSAVVGLEEGSEEVIFHCADGSRVRLYHERDCCERVWLADLTGDASDLVGHRVEIAEERVTSGDGSYGDHETHTFYTIRTVAGSIDMRWVGESNGYYSESVDVEVTP